MSFARAKQFHLIHVRSRTHHKLDSVLNQDHELSELALVSHVCVWSRSSVCSTKLVTSPLLWYARASGPVLWNDRSCMLLHRDWCVECQASLPIKSSSCLFRPVIDTQGMMFSSRNPSKEPAFALRRRASLRCCSAATQICCTAYLPPITATLILLTSSYVLTST